MDPISAISMSVGQIIGGITSLFTAKEGTKQMNEATKQVEIQAKSAFQLSSMNLFNSKTGNATTYLVIAIVLVVAVGLIIKRRKS